MIYEFLIIFIILSFLFGMFLFTMLYEYRCVMSGYYFRVIELRQRRKEIRQKELLAKKQKRLVRRFSTNILKIS